jgi:hypothetical protein
MKFVTNTICELILSICFCFLGFSSFLVSTVSCNSPTLKFWHRPTSELQETHENTIRSCHVHIKCFTEKSIRMTDKLDWTLKHYIGLHQLRTIYDSGNNHSALIPTTERCSLHFLLLSFHSTWQETYGYIDHKIQDFIFRRRYQTALIHVREGSPLTIYTDPTPPIFHLTDGHFFFLDGPTGFLYFRNVRGDSNLWEASLDIEGMISSKMGENWNKRENTAKIAIRTRDINALMNTDINSRRCASLRSPPLKGTLLCTKLTMMAEVAADVLNFTTVYTHNVVNRSIFPSGELLGIYSREFDPDRRLMAKCFGGLIQLSDIVQPEFVYCIYNIQSRSMSFAVWFHPFDKTTWIAIIIFLCFFWLVQIISSRSQFTLQLLNESLLTIFQVAFRQGQSNPKKLSMFFVGCYLLVSFFYENDIISSLIAPSEETPFANITEAVDAGYVLTVDIADEQQPLLFRGENAFFQQNENALRRFGVFKKVTGPLGHRAIQLQSNNIFRIKFVNQDLRLESFQCGGTNVN